MHSFRSYPERSASSAVAADSRKGVPVCRLMINGICGLQRNSGVRRIGTMMAFLVRLILVWQLIPAVLEAQTGNSPAFFESHIRPIFKAHCWHCHGEEEELKGNLDTRLTRFLLQGGDSGPAIAAGDHQASLLYQRIESGDMPPGDSRLSAEEQELIAAWIDQGARTRSEEPESLPRGELISEEERLHWSFRPVSRPDIPDVADKSLVHTEIDAFLVSKLEQHGLSFGPVASRETLLRRVTFDLTGLPATADERDQFLQDESPDAWEKVVDRLLASPAYGERWGRHWLDVAGYADSDGYNERDVVRPWAWRYRDYVIRSLNDDKPWDQFLIEQLAGDELSGARPEVLTETQAEQLTATGFLRMCPDGTAAGGPDQVIARNDVVAETIRVVSSGLLGLTVGCAQCHEHRYDPITQKDYYRLRAIFEPAYDVSNWRVPNARLVSLWNAETRAAAAAVDAELAEISRQRTEELDGIVTETFERELKKLPDDQQPLARAARETPADKRTTEQNQLIREYPFLNVSRGSVYLYLPDRLTGFNKKWDAKTAETKEKRPADELVMCLNEVPGKIPVTRLFSRGDYQQPREEVPPGELSVLADESTVIPVNNPELPSSGRRLAYAKHLTSGEHPLVARVLVNRFWMHHFGQGLVSTPADFGVKGDKPSHPELLDWLARDFMDNGWKLKRFHRQILLSRAWQQSSERRPEHDAVDSDNRLVARMNLRRLEAEAVRDAVLFVSGKLTNRLYGKPVPVSPDDVGQIVVAVDTRDSAGRPSGKVEALGDDEFRRSIYVQVRRSMPLGVLEPFDLPRMTPNCERRPVSTAAPQSLLMMNNPFVIAQAHHFGDRLRGLSSDVHTQIRIAWQLAFGCEPTPSEHQKSVAFLTAAPGAPTETAGMSLDEFCHALFCSGRFLYVE